MDNQTQSSKIEKQITHDKYKNATTDEQVQALLDEADTYIKKNHLSLPEKPSAPYQNPQIDKQMQEIDAILQESQELLDSVDQEEASI